MGKIKIILGLALFAFVLSTGWQLAACELSHYELTDDLKDLAAMGGAQIGLAVPVSDQELRTAVIEHAAEHDIRVTPDQITVRRGGTVEKPTVVLIVKYKTRVAMPGASLILHLTARSR